MQYSFQLPPLVPIEETHHGRVVGRGILGETTTDVWYFDDVDEREPSTQSPLVLSRFIRRVLPLTQGDILVFVFSVRRSDRERASLNSYLDEHESLKVIRIGSRYASEQFAVCRGILRTILGTYSASSPTALRFTYGKWGKPSLVVAGDRKDIRFNLSHSGNLAAVSISLGLDTGIDLEPAIRVKEAYESRGAFLTSKELSFVEKLPPSRQMLHCLTFWVAKEAYLKAIGSGLRRHPRSICLPVNRGRLIVPEFADEAQEGNAFPGSSTNGYLLAISRRVTSKTISIWRLT